jgi:hypothetical protein
MVAPVPAQTSKLPRRKPSCPCSTPNSCRLILLQTLLHSQSSQPLWNQVNPNSFAKTPGVPHQPLTAHYSPLTTHSPLTTFRMNTCKSVSKKSTLTIFRMNTYVKRWRGCSPLAASEGRALSRLPSKPACGRQARGKQGKQDFFASWFPLGEGRGEKEEARAKMALAPHFHTSCLLATSGTGRTAIGGWAARSTGCVYRRCEADCDHG